MNTVDQDKLNHFIGQMLGDLGGASSIAMVRLGDALGLYQALHTNGPMTCAKLAETAKVSERYLREFQDNEKSIPTVLTTSQKLSTGVDARNVRNIVLLRPVNSMIEFKQIVGRGTRLFDGKDFFTI